MLTSKKALRDQLRADLDALSVDEAHARSVEACDRLVATDEFTRAEVIMVFLSLPREINTTSLVLRSWQECKRVVAPRVSWEQRRMMPVEIRSLTEDVERTRWNLPQPAAGDPVPLEMIDLVVVPGLGFDHTGSRLGRGRGFYDRFLGSAQFHGVACALAFEMQVVHEIPVDEHDMSVDMLVTDERVRRFATG